MRAHTPKASLDVTKHALLWLGFFYALYAEKAIPSHPTRKKWNDEKRNDLRFIIISHIVCRSTENGTSNVDKTMVRVKPAETELFA